MPQTCSVSGCRSTSQKECGVQFFLFPLKDVERCKVWADRMDRENWYPTKYSKICSKHFVTSDYLDRPNTYIRKLKPDAIPSVALPTTARIIPYQRNTSYVETSMSDVQTCSSDVKACSSATTLQETKNVQNKLLDTETDCAEFVEKQLTTATPSVEYYVFPLDPAVPEIGDGDVGELADEPVPKKNKYELTPRKARLHAKIKILQQTVRRQKKKIETLSNLLQQLKQKGLIGKNIKCKI